MTRLHHTLATALLSFAALLGPLRTTAFPAASQPCGDLDASGKVAASDALLLLKRAVGQAVNISCAPCPGAGSAALQSMICGDLDGSGKIAATDALLLLKRAVGQNVTISCPPCAASSCGNGVIDGQEQCDRFEGCTQAQRCNAGCSCVALPASPPMSQELIASALRAGTIDYPTSLLYRVWALFQAPQLPAAYDGAGTAGEDTSLFLELSHVRGSLPAAVEQAIAPYLVRPNNPLSIYSQDPSASVALHASRAAAPPSVGCPEDSIGQPDWRAYETTHFVVWSCGGGVGGTDKYAGGRAVTGNVLEQVWDEMTPKLGAPMADDYDIGPQPTARIDVYILDPNQCRIRGGVCVPVPGTALAAAAPASPCVRSGGSALTSSAYIVLGAAQVPASTPGSEDASDFRYALAHELFHAISFGLNLEAQGGVCNPTGPDLVPEEMRSWLTEASAEWASFAFFPDDGQQRRTALFEKFQHERRAATDGLQATTTPVLPYEAFLYPAFLQEENNQNPQTMIEFWTGSQGARTKEDLDARLDQTLPLPVHFRDFAVRNLNRDLPGDPLTPPHSAYDPALTWDVMPLIPEPALQASAPLEIDWPVAIAPLFAAYEHFYLADETRSVRIDASDLPNSEHLHIDAVVNVGGTWERRRIAGPVFEFCREDDGDDIQELYLVFSDDDRDPAGAIGGDFHLTTRTSCPGGWTGSVHMVMTLDEHTQESNQYSSYVQDEHDREEQSWTITETSLVRPPGYPFDVEKVRTGWAAQRSDFLSTKSVDQCGTSYSLDSGAGSGSDITDFYIFPQGNGSFTFTPIDLDTGRFSVHTKYSGCDCHGACGTSSGDGDIYEGIAYIVATEDLTVLQPDPKDPDHFAGTHTILHSEQQRPGGQEILDLTIEWDLTRKPAR